MEENYGVLETINEQNEDTNENLIKNKNSKLVKEDKDEIKRENESFVQKNMEKEIEKGVIEAEKSYGHENVWGSWWNKELGWGYKCCFGTNKYERCLGETAKGIAVLKEYHKKTISTNVKV